MRALALCAALACAGCVTGPDPVTAATRAAAKATVDEYTARRFPGVPLKPVSDCVIDNASASEILAVARRGTEATDTITRVVTRESTIGCIAENGAPLLATALRL